MNEPDHEFPLELVATIAARLLQGDDYATAAWRALDLIEKCDFFRRARAQSNAEWTKKQQQEIEAMQMKRLEAEQKILPWKKAVMGITGKPDESKATTAFRPFFSEIVRKLHIASYQASDEEIIKGVVDDNIKRWRGEGMAVAQMEGLREEYQKMPRRAPRKKK